MKMYIKQFKNEEFLHANYYVVASLLSLTTALKRFGILTKGSHFLNRNSPLFCPFRNKIYFFCILMQLFEAVFYDSSKLLNRIQIGWIRRPREHNFSFFWSHLVIDSEVWEVAESCWNTKSLSHKFSAEGVIMKYLRISSYTYK